MKTLSNSKSAKERTDVVTSNKLADSVIDAIKKHGHNDPHGDRKIYPWDIDNAICMLTDERNALAVNFST